MNTSALAKNYPKTEDLPRNSDLSWMTKTQKNLYDILVQGDNALLSQFQLRQRFGLTKFEAESPSLDPRFKAIWEGLRTERDPFWKFTSTYEKTCLLIAQKAQGKETLRIEDFEARTINVKRFGYSWDVIRHHREFVAELIKMGVDIAPVPHYTYFSVDNLDTSWMNKFQSKLLTYMQENPDVYIRSMSQVAKICSCAPLSAVSCFADSRFKDLIDFHNAKQGRVSDLDREQKLYDFYVDEKNRSISPSDAAVIVFGDRRRWYHIKQNPEFVEKLRTLGVNTSSLLDSYESHDDVMLISNQRELEEFYASDFWDARRIFKDYPRHRGPATYCIDFTKIPQPAMREIIKRYFRIQISTVWKARTGNSNIVDLEKFFKELFIRFPGVETLKDIEREKHIIPVLQGLRQQYSDDSLVKILTQVRALFQFACVNDWKDAPREGLIIGYDLPRQRFVKKPKPIPTYVKAQFDDLLQSQILPALRVGETTPYVSADAWDFFIVLRYTGRRYEDVAHLLEDCVQTDFDGDPVLVVDHRIAKIAKDLHVPLAHLNGLDDGKNVVVEAIMRQKQRVSSLPPAKDGYKYLFRKEQRRKNGDKTVDVFSYKSLSDMLDRILERADIRSEDGSLANISSHQFRHTVASEMIMAGVDVYAVKEFLGHESVRMTESYIKVLTEQLKSKLPESMYQSTVTGALDLSSNNNTDLFNDGWVKNKIIGVFELGDGCCEHPYKLPSCPHMVCKTCIKKKIYPRHRDSVVMTIESTKAHLAAATQLGLSEKASELEKVLEFHEEALKVIDTGKVFSASYDYYRKRGM